MKAANTLLAVALIACFASFASAQLRIGVGNVSVGLGNGGLNVQTPKFGISTGGFQRGFHSGSAFHGHSHSHSYPVQSTTYHYSSGPVVSHGCTTHGHLPASNVVIGQWRPVEPRGHVVNDDPRDPRGGARGNRGRGTGRQVASGEYSRLLGLEVIETRSGLEVVKVDPRSPAADADLREGDVIVAIGRNSVRSLADLEDEVDAARNTVLLIVEDSRGQEFETEIGL